MVPIIFLLALCVNQYILVRQGTKVEIKREKLLLSEFELLGIYQVEALLFE